MITIMCCSKTCTMYKYKGCYVETNGVNVFGFLSSLPLLPPATTAVFGSFTYSCLSTLN
jgi:hypothetical protein